MEGDGNNNEDAEEEELNEETTDNHFCSGSESLDGTGRLIATTFINKLASLMAESIRTTYLLPAG